MGRVDLLGCFASDKRTSMDVYQHALANMLHEYSTSYTCINPSHSLETFNRNKWVMRFLRYVYYPFKVQSMESANTHVSHVIDHGYAHLRDRLPKHSKSIVTVHDLIPYLTWKGIIPSESSHRPRLNLYSMRFVQKFDHVVTPSQSTANDLSKYFSVDASRITVIPPILPDYFSYADGVSRPKLKSALGFNESSRVVIISGSEHYKNWQTSLLAVKELRDKGLDVKVIKTGRPSRDFIKFADRLEIEQHVQSRFVADHQDMVDLYRCADCLLFPSWYEGFGMPVAESLACGTPAVVSDRASLKEVGGDLALYTEPDDLDTMVRCLENVLYDDTVKQRVVDKSEAWVEQFRKRDIFEKFRILYELA